MNPYFFIMEFGAIFIFLAALYHKRKDKKMLEMLVLAFIYGIILEILDIYMSHTYSYGRDFIFQILAVPIAIGAGWAIIYYLSYSTAKKFNLAWWQSPLLMALIALSYDLSLDVIAIRLGFWKWNIVSMNEEWFGVPYDNFFGWLAVVWTFALFMNLSFQDFIKPRLAQIIRWTAPVASSLLLGMEIMAYQNISAILSGKFTPAQVQILYLQQQYYYSYMPEVRAIRYSFLMILLLLSIFLCATWIYQRRKSTEKSIDKFPFYLSLATHFIFLLLLLVSGIYKISWILPAIALSALISTIGLELFLGHLYKS